MFDKFEKIKKKYPIIRDRTAIQIGIDFNRIIQKFNNMNARFCKIFKRGI